MRAPRAQHRLTLQQLGGRATAKKALAANRERDLGMQSMRAEMDGQGRRKYTLEDIGARYGLTKQRVAVILARMQVRSSAA